MLLRLSESIKSRAERRGLLSLFPEDASADTEVAVVVARPGDAVRAAGETIAELPNVRVLQLGDGAPEGFDRMIAAGFHSRKEYAAALRERIEAAFEKAPTQMGFESGRLPQQMAGIALALADTFRREQPEIILTQSYEGNDPDEDTAAFAVQAACALLVNEGRVAPARLEFATTGRFVAHPFAESVAIRLDEAQRARKEAICARLEIEPLDVEVFRAAPIYDFTRPPHAGTLAYDTDAASGITGARWRRLAAEALRVLGLG